MFRPPGALVGLILIGTTATAQFNNNIRVEPDSSKWVLALNQVENSADLSIVPHENVKEITPPSASGLKAKPWRNTKYRYKAPAETFGEFAVTSGLWVPMGWNQTLGVHPALGMMVGGWRDRTLYELNLEFRFLDAANNYTVIYEGSPLTQRKYFGGFIGVHMGYAVVCYKSASIYLLAGCGYDGFDVVEGDDTHDPLSINVFSKNVGLGIQHYDKTGGFIGIEATYNLTNYKNPGGTLLNGDAVMIRLLIGIGE